MEEALDALSRGLAGKTRGLLQFGIAINEADIKQKAYDMGLLHVGNTLTETGTALASYALIMERSARINGEAERTAGQAGKSFAFLKRDVSELADNVSHLVLPALSDMANRARDVVKWLGSLDESTVKTFFAIAGSAALIGPGIAILVRMVDGIVKLRAAYALLSTGTFFTSLAAVPFATIAVGIGGIALAIGGLALAWQHFKEQDKSGAGPFASMSGLADDPRLQKALGMTSHPGVKLNLEHVAPSEAQLQTFPGGKNAATEVAPMVDALKQLEERASRAGEMVKLMGDVWNDAIGGEAVRALASVDAALSKIADKSSKQAVELRNAYEGLASVLGDVTLRQSAIAALPNGSVTPGVAGGVREGITFNPQAKELPGFTAANAAALRYAETQAYVTEKTAYEYQALRQNLEQFGIHLSNVGERMQTLVVNLAYAAQQIAYQFVNMIGGSGSGAGTGRGIGGLLGAAIGSAVPGVGTFVGGLVGTAAGGLIGSLFDHAKTSTDNAASSMDTLAKTVEKVNASIRNVPQWFKVQTVRFAAAPVQYAPPFVPTPGGRAGPSGGGGGGASMTINEVHVHVAQTADASDMEALTSKLYAHALKQRGTGARAPLIFARTGGL